MGGIGFTYFVECLRESLHRLLKGSFRRGTVASALLGQTKIEKNLGLFVTACVPSVALVNISTASDSVVFDPKLAGRGEATVRQDLRGPDPQPQDCPFPTKKIP